jgi:hypothetical protein
MHVHLYGTCVLENYIYLCQCMSPHCQFVTVKYGEESIRVFDGLKNLCSLSHVYSRSQELML